MRNDCHRIYVEKCFVKNLTCKWKSILYKSPLSNLRTIHKKDWQIWLFFVCLFALVCLLFCVPLENSSLLCWREHSCPAKGFQKVFLCSAFVVFEKEPSAGTGSCGVIKRTVIIQSNFTTSKGYQGPILTSILRYLFYFNPLI